MSDGHTRVVVMMMMTMVVVVLVAAVVMMMMMMLLIWGIFLFSSYGSGSLINDSPPR